MKKISFLSLALICVLSTANMHAQDQKSTVYLNAGFSLVGGFFSLPNTGYSGDVSNYSYPAIQAGYDYYFINWFSMGLAGSFQTMGVDYDNYEYEQDEFVDGELDVIRINVGIKALFHYVNRDRISMYSGLRMGLTNWNIDENLSDETYEYDNVLSSTGTLFAPQLVLYGLRGYFTDNFGANIELAIGAPHFFSAGVNYRF